MVRTQIRKISQTTPHLQDSFAYRGDILSCAGIDAHLVPYETYSRVRVSMRTLSPTLM